VVDQNCGIILAAVSNVVLYVVTATTK